MKIGRWVRHSLLIIGVALAASPATARAAVECAGATIVGTAGPDILTGTAGSDVIDGLGGADTIDGGDGDDIICGDSGADSLAGGAGDDILLGGLGNDLLNGGAGADHVSYEDRTDPVGASLATGSGGVGVEVDTLVAIEDLTGGSGNDTLVGDAGSNRLSGGTGDDTLDGGLGADALVGSAGVDVVSYAGRPSTAPVTASLAAGGGGQAGEADVYSFAIEGLIGGSGPDVLAGDAGANRLSGGPGDDQLVGAGGSDHLDGGTGADRFEGGADDDTLDARDRGADLSFDCGGGADTLLPDVPADDATPRSGCETGAAADADGDAVPDSLDNCPAVANPNQADGDANGIGDACTPTSPPPPPPIVDRDRDGILDTADNCPDAANSSQSDDDADAIGDACETLASGTRMPVAGVSAVVRVLSGEVFVKLPGRAAARGHAAHAAALSDPGFIPLKGNASVPVGSTIDTREGRVGVGTATAFPGRPGGVQTSTFAAGIFQIKQARRRARRSPRTRPVTDIRLVTPLGGAAVCITRVRTDVSRSLVRSLSVVLKGRYRVLGAASSATVTNATLVVKDRCDGTVTQVGRGIARVYDRRLRRTVTVRAGQAYLARGRTFDSIKGRPARAARAGAGGSAS